MGTRTEAETIYRQLCWLHDQVSRVLDLDTQLNSLQCPTMRQMPSSTKKELTPESSAEFEAKCEAFEMCKKLTIVVLGFIAVALWLYAKFLDIQVVKVSTVVIWGGLFFLGWYKDWFLLKLIPGIVLAFTAFGFVGDVLSVFEQDKKAIFIIVLGAAIWIPGSIFLYGPFATKIRTERQKKIREENEERMRYNEKRDAYLERVSKEIRSEYAQKLQKYEQQRDDIQSELSDQVSILQQLAPGWYFTNDLSLWDIEYLIGCFQKGQVTTWQEAANKLDEYYFRQQVRSDLAGIRNTVHQQVQSQVKAIQRQDQMLAKMSQMARTINSIQFDQVMMMGIQQEMVACQREIARSSQAIEANRGYLSSRSILELDRIRRIGI